ncbi:MAG: EI24 domain-containing protein [Desulfofustis sp.]|nr:EI24 domain-containing protein [Desulfofustis sp.]
MSLSHPTTPRWIPLWTSFTFLLRSGSLVSWSLALTLATALLTWLGFHLSTDLLDSVTGSFLTAEPARDGWLGWLKYSGWWLASSLFIFISRIIAFFVAFLLAYTLTSPFYSFLSAATEKRFLGSAYQDDEKLSISGILRDLFEGLKIAGFGIVVTIIAVLISLVPFFGQLAVIFLYTCYATLMFIDYPTSRKRWSLGHKLTWLRLHLPASIRLGIFPAVIGMIPVLNVLLMALFFPLLTVHATLNFCRIEQTATPPPETRGSAKPTPA